MGRRHKHKTGTYPQSLFFLMGTSFSERFNYYAFRGILSIYITDMLMYTEHGAKIIYHLFAAAIYIMPLMGAVVADIWFGKYKTILYSTLLYVAGSVTLSASAIKSLELEQTELAMFGLVTIALGAGGIKACVVAFGGEQFALPKEQQLLTAYFRFFYFFINLGTFLSLLITPILRRRVQCLDEFTCFPLAFFVPAALMLLAIAVFRAGKSLFKMAPPKGSMLLKFVACSWAGWRNRAEMRREVQRDHWLDYAVEQHGEETVSESKRVFKILLVFLPLPMFWALFEQQATAWTFQARQLNGDIGEYLTVLPDQMQVLNPALFLIFIPLFENTIYPGLRRLKILRSPLQRMAVGGILAGFAFVLAAVLQFAIESFTPKPLSAENGILRVINVFNCPIQIQSKYFATSAWRDVGAMSSYSEEVSTFSRQSIDVKGSCTTVSNKDIRGQLPEKERYLTCYNFEKNMPVWCQLEDVTHVATGDCRVRIIVNLNEQTKGPAFFKFFDSSNILRKQFYSEDRSYHYLPPGEYGIETSCSSRYYVTFSTSGVYAVGIVVVKDGDNYTIKNFEIFQTNTLHMAWLLPQYAFMTAAEVLFTIPGLEFTYEEAPDHMKSVVQSFWLLGIGIGQLIVVLISIIRIRYSIMYLLYAGLMFVAMAAFILTAVRKFDYAHIDPEKEEEGEAETETKAETEAETKAETEAEIKAEAD